MLLNLRRRRAAAPPVVYTGQAAPSAIARVRYTERHEIIAIEFEGLEFVAPARVERRPGLEVEFPADFDAASTYRYVRAQLQHVKVLAVSELVGVIEFEGRARHVSRALENAKRNRRLLMDLDEL